MLQYTHYLLINKQFITFLLFYLYFYHKHTLSQSFYNLLTSYYIYKPLLYEEDVKSHNNKIPFISEKAIRINN